LARLKWSSLLKSVRLPLQMLGGSAREGVCIAAGIAVVGGCERMNEKGVRGGGAYVVCMGAE
jgi:hypothetical protein